MEILIAVATILISSLVIYFAGEKFAETSSNLGDYLQLPRDVKGATFDAVSSSLPELLVALYSVIFFQQFDVGIGTIAGSALFNLLVIPGICVFVTPVTFKVSKKVISRDALFYLIAVFALVTLLYYFQIWGFEIAILLLGLYGIYFNDIVRHTKKHKKETTKEKPPHIQLTRELPMFLGLMGVIGIFTFFLTDSAINLASALGIAPIIVAFTIIAAATSVPDTIISITNAKKGDIDDATSNVFGSNVFDILIGLGLPLLIYTTIKGSVEIDFSNMEIVFGLLGATIMLLYFFAAERTLSKKHAAVLLMMYFGFVGYVVYLASA